MYTCSTIKFFGPLDLILICKRKCIEKSLNLRRLPTCTTVFCFFFKDAHMEVP